MTGTAKAAEVDDDDIVRILKSWTIEQALPLWSGEGWDAARGGFVECLGPDGCADVSAPRRVRVQARQIYCFAKAAQLGWFAHGRDVALRGLDYLLLKAKSPDRQPGFVHLLDADGACLDPKRDTYDHAFILLALATLYQLTRDGAIREELDALLGFLDAKMRSPHGGFVEGIPATSPRRQNPQMHLFEAMIAAFDATEEVAFQNRAGELFQLFVASFFDARRGVLGEYFEDDWSPIEPLVVEPGHQAEWIWLLKGFERITGCPTGRHRAQLLASSLRYRDDFTGFLFDEGDADGTVRRFTRRLWPQTEIAKAWIAQAEGGDTIAADQATRALGHLYRAYLRHPVSGGWYDQFDRDNKSLVASIPASSFYHILCAVTEADRVLG